MKIQSSNNYLNSNHYLKINFQKMLQNISGELDLNNYSTEEINATFEIFQEVGSRVETINTFSIQNQEISIEDSHLLNQL